MKAFCVSPATIQLLHQGRSLRHQVQQQQQQMELREHPMKTRTRGQQKHKNNTTRTDGNKVQQTLQHRKRQPQHTFASPSAQFRPQACTVKITQKNTNREYPLPPPPIRPLKHASSDNTNIHQTSNKTTKKIKPTKKQSHFFPVLFDLSPGD